MNHRITARLRSLAGSRGLPALLAVVMLNMVILPCATAFGLDDHDCPHCPPEEQHEMAGHHGHNTSARVPCAESQAQCCDVEAASIDSRSGQPKVRDAGEVEAFAGTDITVQPAQTLAGAEPAPRPPDPPGAFPPRHKLYCVYLD